MNVFGCQPEAIIVALTALIGSITALIQQFRHQRAVSKQMNGAPEQNTPAGTGTPAP